MFRHSISVKRLRELLDALRDEDLLVPNQAVNLAILRDEKYIGFVNLLEGSAMSEQPITADDLDNLRHMLGVSEKTPRGYRNYFVAGADNVASMERLKAAGFVVKNERYTGSADPCYHATTEGARAVGLKSLPK